MSFSSKMEKLKRNGKFALPFDKCPDYYVRKDTTDKTICSNEYLIKDEYKNSYLMKIFPQNDEQTYDLPNSHNPNYNINVSSGMKYDKFILNELETSTLLKNPADKCNVLFHKPTDNKLYTYNDYHVIPWISAKSRCEAFT